MTELKETAYPKSGRVNEGAPVLLPAKLLDIVELSFGDYQLNLVASDRVAANRSLPDLRNPKCLDIRYPMLLPTTSVIIVIHNEAWSVLLRAIHSVLNRSPDNLLEEVILVDDFSDKPHLKEPFDAYVEKLGDKVKLIRTDKREGLIRARVIGAEHAQGQVLIFLDGNTESNDGWLEPLLSRIASDRSVIAIPHVDNINFTNMAYEEFDEGLMYGLGWNLYYKTFPIPLREIRRNHGDVTAPYRTPALIGCAIAIDREFFFEIGSFDTAMNIWGGENTELSLRVWQCGGAMEIVPCSRVGHFFRTLPYSFNADKDEIKIQNNIRTAEVWMDEYKPYFDVVIPMYLKKVKGGDVSERLALRDKLRCKGFRWYLNNIFPESIMLAGFEKIGQIQKKGTKFCLDTLGRSLNDQIGIYGCHGHGYSQGFAYQKNKQIVFHHSLCLGLAEKENITEQAIVEPVSKVEPAFDEILPVNLSVSTTMAPIIDTTNHVVLLKCNATSGEKWHFNEAKSQIVHIESGMCLQTELWMVIVAPCDLKEERQTWVLNTFEEFKQNLLTNVDKMDRANP